ncbi:MAG: stage IV sporulation protein A, partial [Christensenellales bacterium]
MDNYDIYRDIATRTDGDIYIGVVGPVRTGKSSFIKKFMELLVLPNIEDKNKLRRSVDEMPQSGDGKTIMTTQPRFVPSDAVRVNLAENVAINMRMIDCVGYLVDGALGHVENGKPRMVRTPWS